MTPDSVSCPTFSRCPLAYCIARRIVEAFDVAQQRHAQAVADLVPLVIEMALASVAEGSRGPTSLKPR